MCHLCRRNSAWSRHACHDPGTPNGTQLAGGAIIGALGGLIGLGGAEFRLPLLIGVFRFAALRAVILNKAMSLLVGASALPFRASTVPFFRPSPTLPTGACRSVSRGQQTGNRRDEKVRIKRLRYAHPEALRVGCMLCASDENNFRAGPLHSHHPRQSNAIQFARSECHTCDKNADASAPESGWQRQRMAPNIFMAFDPCNHRRPMPYSKDGDL